MSNPKESAVEAAERLLQALDDAGRGYSIRLTRLVDEVAEYTMVYRGETTIHASNEDAHEFRRVIERQDKIDAALAFIAAMHATQTDQDKLIAELVRALDQIQHSVLQARIIGNDDGIAQAKYLDDAIRLARRKVLDDRELRERKAEKARVRTQGGDV